MEIVNAIQASIDVHDNLSNILGWVSIACWIIVYSPQIYENYSLKSGEGLSVGFVIVWLLGDLSNVIGAVLANLLPTVILLGVYYTLCDIILLSQIYYYRWARSRQTYDEGEAQPLLPPTGSANTITSTKTLIFQYGAALIFVLSVGLLAWRITDHDPPSDEPSDLEGRFETGARTLGWISAVFYLGARFPQIVKNFKTRCEGLSPALFFFAIFGNATYALSICAKSMEIDYLMKNAGWLAGSALTVFLDVIVLCQFFYYRSADWVGTR